MRAEESISTAAQAFDQGGLNSFQPGKLGQLVFLHLAKADGETATTARLEGGLDLADHVRVDVEIVSLGLAEIRHADRSAEGSHESFHFGLAHRIGEAKDGLAEIALAIDIAEIELPGRGDGDGILHGLQGLGQGIEAGIDDRATRDNASDEKKK